MIRPPRERSSNYRGLHDSSPTPNNQRREECSFGFPSSSDSSTDTIITNSEMRADILKAAANAAHRNCYDLATIPALLRCCLPAAIRWRIWAIVVSAIQRESGGCFSHIVKKVNERRTPAFADLDSTTAVITVAMVIRVLAPLNHVGPGMVGFGHSGPARVPVSCASLSCDLRQKASARPSTAHSQTVVPNNNLSSAITSAKARALTFPVSAANRGGDCNHGKSSKLRTDRQSYGRHNSDPFVVVFSCGGQHQLASATIMCGS